MGRILSGMATGFTETAKRDMRGSNSVFARSMAASMDKRERQRAKEPAFEEPTAPVDGYVDEASFDGQYYPGAEQAPVQKCGFQGYAEPAKAGFSGFQKLLIVVGIVLALSLALPILLTVFSLVI